MRAAEFRTIQILRGAAAMLVVAYHSLEMWTLQIGKGASASWPRGAAGVDLFFVISGFVMICASSRLPPGAWRPFLRRRLVRIVPFYWLMTACKIAATWAAPSLALRTTLSASTIAASLLFLPVLDASGHFRPVLPVGWTLSFEMLFYLLFAMALARRLPPLLAVTPPLLLLATMPPPPGAVGQLCNPMVLEFVFGMAIGMLWLRGRQLSPRIAVVLGIVAVLMLFLIPRPWLLSRPLAWGVPAAAIVASSVALEDRVRPFLPRLLTRLGDASYAIYLSHGFVIAAIPALLHMAGHQRASPAATLLLGLTLSAAAGYALHLTVEKPLLALFAAGGGRHRADVPGFAEGSS